MTYILKEKLYLSEPLLCIVFGILIGPHCLGWLVPLDWTGNEQHTLNEVTYQVVRIVIGIQVYVHFSKRRERERAEADLGACSVWGTWNRLYAGVSLPKAYLKKNFQSLCVLLLPVMVLAWLASSLLIWGMFPHLQFVSAEFPFLFARASLIVAD